MSTQNNFDQYPFMLADTVDASPLPEFGEVETIAPEFDALPENLCDELDSLAYASVWAGLS